MDHGHPGDLLLEDKCGAEIVEDTGESRSDLDGSVAVDPGAELDPLCGVVRGLLYDAPHGAGQGRAHPEPTVVQDLHRHLREEEGSGSGSCLQPNCLDRIRMITLKPSPGLLSTFSTGMGVFSKYTWGKGAGQGEGGRRWYMEQMA